MTTVVKRKRWEMQLILSELPLSETWTARPISQSDAPILGQLMYEAYYGTVDYGGETLEELLYTTHITLSGKYGPLLSTCSFLIEEQGKALGASIVTYWADRRIRTKCPLLNSLMVHPTARGQGMGTFLVKKSINALLARGEKECVLYVTVRRFIGLTVKRSAIQPQKIVK